MEDDCYRALEIGLHLGILELTSLSANAIRQFTLQKSYEEGGGDAAEGAAPDAVVVGAGVAVEAAGGSTTEIALAAGEVAAEAKRLAGASAPEMCAAASQAATAMGGSPSDAAQAAGAAVARAKRAAGASGEEASTADEWVREEVSLRCTRSPCPPDPTLAAVARRAHRSNLESKRRPA